MEHDSKYAKYGFVLTMATFSYFLATNGTWSPDYPNTVTTFGSEFFRNQAISILHGHLWVPSISQNSECFIRDGHCYAYFGIFPSLFRIPFMLLLNSTAISLAPISIAVASGLAMWSVLTMLDHVLATDRVSRLESRDRQLMTPVIALFLGFASPLVLLSQSKMYREAIVWMVALVLLAFAMTLKWMATNRTMYLVVALAAGTGATNSRPSAVPIMFGLGAWLCLVCYRKAERLDPREFLLPLAIAIVPALTSVGVVVLKFHTLSLPWDSYVLINSYIAEINRLNNGHLQGARFVLTNLAQYFRPDSVSYSLTEPWARALVPHVKPYILVKPMVPGSMLNDEVVSLTNTMPVQLLLTLCVFAGRFRRKVLAQYFDFTTAIPLLLISASASVLTLTQFTSTSRYAGDFFPLFAVGTIFGGVGIASWLNEKQLLRPVLYCAMLVGGFFSLVHYSLNVNGWGSIG